MSVGNKGKLNTYTCRACGSVLVTIDRDDGVTPMFIDCQACGGQAVSAWYCCDQSLTPTHEWYALSPKQIRRQPPSYRDHYERGGLAFREIVS